MSLPRSVCGPRGGQIDSTVVSMAPGNQSTNETEDISPVNSIIRSGDQTDETKIDNNELYPVGNECDKNDDAPYCSLSERRKISVMLIASFSGIISPISASIYYPALPTLAKDMHVSISLINLTIMTYLVCNLFYTTSKRFLYSEHV